MIPYKTCRPAANARIWPPAAAPRGGPNREAMVTKVNYMHHLSTVHEVACDKGICLPLAPL
jgi:hypothetical protein